MLYKTKKPDRVSATRWFSNLRGPMMSGEGERCALCALSIGSFSLFEGEKRFCCSGCHAVYMVLQARNELSKELNHPLIREAAQAGLISNPQLLNHLREKELEAAFERRRFYFSVGGLWCPSCCVLIGWILQKKEGVLRCFIDYATDGASVEYNPRKIDREAILRTIRSLGYTVEELDGGENPMESPFKLRSVVCSFFGLNTMMLAYPLYAMQWDVSYSAADGELFAYLSLASALPVLTYGLWPLLKRFCLGLWNGFLGMESLVVVSVVAASCLSFYHLWNGSMELYFDTATAIVTFVLIGKWVESRAKGSTKSLLRRLARSQPKRGRKLMADGSFAFSPIGEIAVGDFLKVYMGEKIILDGIVVEGEGSCDEALMTGEALPIDKGEGARLVGGSLLMRGALLYRVVATAETSIIQRIIATIEGELPARQRESSPIDALARWFVPLILVLAVCAALGADTGQEALIRGLATLTIACPCALGIALPLAEAQLVQRLAALGVVVRNRGCLSFLGRESLFAFDKTGTMTHGHYSVIDGLQQLNEHQLAAVKAMAQLSTHPVAEAIARAISIDPLILAMNREFPGMGLLAIIEGVEFRIGSASFMKSQNIDIQTDKKANQPNKGPMTLCWIAQGMTPIAMLTLGDTLRQEAVAVLAALKPATSALLSGDSFDAVHSVISQCPFDTYRWRCSPLDKREFILEQQRRGKVVAMVGDGVNDAPAMTAAQIGISVMTASDLSIQIADLMLTADSLKALPQACILGRVARRIGHQNLFWSFFYNITGIGLAFFGYLTPIYSAFAMALSSAIVVCNAQRIRVQSEGVEIQDKKTKPS